MKKLLFILVLILLFTMSFVACDKTEDTASISTDIENKYAEINKQLKEITIDIAEIKETIDVNTSKAKEFRMNINEIYTKLVIVENFVDEVAGYEEVYGYIKAINIKENYLTFDKCEFLGVEDEKRLIELGYNPENDLPSAFLIHNPSEDTEKYLVKDTTKYIIYNLNPGYDEKEVSFEIFFKRESERSGFYCVKVMNDVVLEVFEVYLP